MLPDASEMRIGSCVVGDGAPLFVIAEIGLNHGGSVDRALALVDAAAAAGASAVKLQTLIADDLVAPGLSRARARRRDVAARLLRAVRARRGGTCAHRRARTRTRAWPSWRRRSPRTPSTMLERIGVDAYKIASGDLTWDALIVRCAATGKPLVISTGMATLVEVTARARLRRTAAEPSRRGPALRVGLPGAEGSENLPRDRDARAGVSGARSACPTTAPTRSPCRWPSPGRGDLRTPPDADAGDDQRRCRCLEHASRTGRHHQVAPPGPRRRWAPERWSACRPKRPT